MDKQTRRERRLERERQALEQEKMDGIREKRPYYGKYCLMCWTENEDERKQCWYHTTIPFCDIGGRRLGGDRGCGQLLNATADDGGIADAVFESSEEKHAMSLRCCYGIIT